MTRTECGYEKQFVNAICAGRWPSACDEELRNHVQSCSTCNDVVTVAGALQDDYSAVVSTHVQVPSAGLVWWRAELRARREAVRSAERPLRVVHALSGACALGVMAALISRISPWIREFFSNIVIQNLPIALTLGIVAVLAPVALYVVFSDK
jgi:hypothetical protein